MAGLPVILLFPAMLLLGGGWRVRGQQDDFVRPESQPLQPGEDHGLEFGPHDHEVEAEDQAALHGAFQENDRDFDGVEDR